MEYLRAVPDRLQLRAWEDPTVDSEGFDPLSAYVEFCWLPLLGPTATMLYQRLGPLVTAKRQFSLDARELSSCLGLGSGLGRNSLLAKAIARLCRFGVTRWGGEMLEVRRVIVAVPPRHLGRLHGSARLIHDDTVGLPPGTIIRSPHRPPLEPPRRPQYVGYL